MTKKSFIELSQDERENFVNDYYNSEESVKQVMDKYSLSGNSSRIVSFLPPIEVDFNCPYCGLIMYEKAISRTEYIRRQQRTGLNESGDIFCECGHKDKKQSFNEQYCNCNSCQEHKRAYQKIQLNKKQERFQNLLTSQQKNASSLNSLDSLLDYTLVLSFIMYLSEENLYIMSINNLSKIPFFPTQNLGFKYISHLIDNGILGLKDTADNYEYINFKESATSYSYQPYNMQYQFILEDIDAYTTADVVSICENPSIYFGIEYDALDIWKEIAVDELTEYLHYLFEKFNFHTDYIGEAILEKLEVILEDFSVSQGYAILYSSVSSAAAFKQTGVTHKHAVNSINTNIATNIAKRKSGDWVAKGYKRNYDLPQSALSTTFFDNILKIGEKGFTQIPRLENIPSFVAKNNTNQASPINHLIYEGLRQTLYKLRDEDLLNGYAEMFTRFVMLELKIKQDNKESYIEVINCGLELINILTKEEESLII